MSLEKYLFHTRILLNCLIKYFFIGLTLKIVKGILKFIGRTIRAIASACV